MAGLWDSVSKGLAEVSKKAGEIWDGVANVVAPVPGEDGHPPVATSGAREVWGSSSGHPDQSSQYGQQQQHVPAGSSTPAGGASYMSSPPANPAASRYGASYQPAGAPPYAGGGYTSQVPPSGMGGVGGGASSGGGYASTTMPPQPGAFPSPSAAATTGYPGMPPSYDAAPAAPPAAYRGPPGPTTTTYPMPSPPSGPDYSGGSGGTFTPQPHPQLTSTPLSAMGGGGGGGGGPPLSGPPTTGLPHIATPAYVHSRPAAAARPSGRSTPVFKPDGFVTTAGNKELGDKYGNTTGSNRTTVTDYAYAVSGSPSVGGGGGTRYLGESPLSHTPMHSTGPSTGSGTGSGTYGIGGAPTSGVNSGGPPALYPIGSGGGGMYVQTPPAALHPSYPTAYPAAPPPGAYPPTGTSGW